MRFISDNVDYDDCVVVAIYNALIAIGSTLVYTEVLDTCRAKGWYSPGDAFQCGFLEDAFAHFGLKANLLKDVNTKQIYRDITTENKIYFFFRPFPPAPYMPGHAFVAVKGEKGVKLVNPFWQANGWRTASKEMKKGVQHFAIELEKAA